MQHHHPEIVLALVEHGADVTLDTHGATPLAAVCHQGMTPEVLQALVEAGADVNIQTPDGRSALSLARQFEREEVIELLLDHGAIDDAVPSAPLPSRPDR
jgi:ankyrin repeat protein